MYTRHTFAKIFKLGTSFAVITLLLAGCGGSSSTGTTGGGAVQGVTTPSKVSVVNTN